MRRRRKWSKIIREQVELSYYANIPPECSDEMSIFEKKTFYKKLKEIKEKEKEKIQEAKEENS